MTNVNITEDTYQVTVTEGVTQVVTVKAPGPQGPIVSDGDKGDITVASNGTSVTVNAGAINNAKIASNAAIGLSKLATGALPTGITISSANIPDLTIVNSDVSASAAIEGSKLQASSGSNSGTMSAADFTKLAGIESNATADQSKSDIDALGIAASTAATLANARTIAGTSFDGSANIDISYTNLTNKLSVGDGGLTQNNFTDALKTKLDGLTSSSGVLTDGVTATTQSASDNSTKVATTAYTDTAISNLVNSAPSTLDTLKELSDALGSDPNFATTVTNSIATKLPLAGGTLSGNLTIENTEPQIFLKDSNNNDDFTIRNTNGVFTVRDSTNAVDRLTIDSSGKGTFTTALDVTGDLTIESTLPQIILKDTDNDDDFTIKNTNGVFTIRDSTNGVDRLTIASNGTVDITNRLDVGSNLQLFTVNNDSDINHLNASGAIRLRINSNSRLRVTNSGAEVTGNISVSGTVDGRDLATDGTKLDGIESGATADQTASDIKTLLNSDGIVNAQIDASAAIAGTKISPDFGSQNITTTGNLNAKDIVLTDTVPLIVFNDSDNENDFAIGNINGTFVIQDQDGGPVQRFSVASNGQTTISGNLDCGAGVDITGDLTVSEHIALSDNKKLQLGNSQDLQIFHSGTNSFIDDQGTGSLFIKSNNFEIANANGLERMAKFIENGAVEAYFDNEKRFETTQTGATVTTTSAANSIKNITTSTSAPSGGSDGDLWFTYIA